MRRVASEFRLTRKARIANLGLAILSALAAFRNHEELSTCAFRAAVGSGGLWQREVSL